jgi:rhodanese-related sulfurtransferase
MNEILDFFRTHWQLSGAFVLLLLAYIGFEVMQSTEKREITPEQAVELYNHKHAMICDVRTAEEFSSGHLIGAQNITMDEVLNNAKKLQKYVDKPLIMVCAAGKRSMRCVKHLETQGFSQVVSIAGGVHAWETAGLPLTKD